MKKIAFLASFAFLSLTFLAGSHYQVQLSNTGTITEALVTMQPPEVIFDFGTMQPGQRRDIFHQLVAELTITEKLPITAALDVDSAVHFNIIGIWIQLQNIETGSPRDYFISQTTPSETRTIYPAIYHVYYDGTFYALENITESVSGHMITTLSYNDITVGIFKIKYTINP